EQRVDNIMWKAVLCRIMLGLVRSQQVQPVACSNPQSPAAIAKHCGNPAVGWRSRHIGRQLHSMESPLLQRRLMELEESRVRAEPQETLGIRHDSVDGNPWQAVERAIISHREPLSRQCSGEENTDHDQREIAVLHGGGTITSALWRSIHHKKSESRQ